MKGRFSNQQISFVPNRSMYISALNPPKLSAKQRGIYLITLRIYEISKGNVIFSWGSNLKDAYVITRLCEQ